MKLGKPTKRELDRLGKRLVMAGRIGGREIDEIVSDPRLYDGVLAKIAKTGETTHIRKPILAWKFAAVSSLIISVSLIGYLAFSNVSDVAQSKPRAIPPVYTVDEKPFVLNDVPTKIDSHEQTTERPKPIQAVMTKRIESVPAPKSRRLQTTRVQLPEPAFYPIGLAEKAEDAAIDGRVVRVEMPRSALFAMGVDLPLENGTRSVKADLLVGADGTPRAIRLVE